MISITPIAAEKIMAYCREQGKRETLRLYTEPGKCAGHQYAMDFNDSTSDGDLVFEAEGLRVIVDGSSIPYLEGAEVDYVNTLMKTGFEIKNPNAAWTCTCGKSFTVADETTAASGLH